MSVSTTYSDVTAPGRAETRTLLLIIWAVTVLTYLFTGLAGELSTDDAMRLVEVRDFLDGQNWFDLTQYRLDPPLGVAMHWSRLIDLPLALLIRSGELLLPAGYAERLALLVWPSTLMLLFFAGTVRLARELAGDVAAREALLFAAIAAPVLQHFRPGAIDHHNAQLVLLVWSLALATRLPARPREGALAGAMCALSLAIGQEMAPPIAALAVVVALRWIVMGVSERAATAGFALALAIVTYALFGITVPAAHYWTAECDALSIVQVVAAGLGGVGLAALTVLPLPTIKLRLAGAATLTVIVAATMGLGFPACLGDPYGALDPRLSALWLANVSEARNILSMMRDLPQEVLPSFGLPAAALVLGAIRCFRERERWPWIFATGVLAVLFVIAIWEIRGAAAANAIAAALAPAALMRARLGEQPVFFGLGRAALVAVLLLNPLALIAIGSGLARAAATATGQAPPRVIADGAGTCRRAADYTPLATLPRGLVLGFIDAGPFILMETPHSVLAAPYHRNNGNSAMLDVMLDRPDKAAARLAELGIDYVVFCPGSPERYNYAAAAPEGLAAMLSRGEVPDFLERIPLDGTDLQVYRQKH